MHTIFTVSEAFEADEVNDPIMLEWDNVEEIIEDHGETLDTFTADHPCVAAESQLNAATLMSWLGY